MEAEEFHGEMHRESGPTPPRYMVFTTVRVGQSEALPLLGTRRSRVGIIVMCNRQYNVEWLSMAI